MAYDARTRQRYRHAVSAVTGVAALGVLTACGWVAGLAARDHQQGLDQKLAAEEVAAGKAQQAWQTWVAQRRAWEQAKSAEILAHPHVRTVWKKRVTRTVIDTRVVHVAPVGTGGSLSSGSSSGSGSSSSSHSAGHSSGGTRHSSGHTASHSTTHSSASSSSSSSSHSSSGSSSSSSSGASPAPPPPPPPPAPTHGS